jgi:TPP-dependent pyruvate/acetoin dehydrogenase alpha subunit
MRNKGKEKIAAAGNGFSLISGEKLLTLYASMLKCRMIEERASALFVQRESAGSCHSALGQEASAVGAAIDLLPEDFICSPQVDMMVNFTRGVALDKLFRDLFARCAGTSTHAAAAREGNRLSIAAAQLNMAASAALANKIEGKRKVGVIFSGAEAALPDCWRETLDFAGAECLPIVFVCQNDLKSVPARLKAQTKVKDPALKTPACGFPCITVDGNDVVAVYRVACEAIAHARLGHGPTLIACQTWRLSAAAKKVPGKARNRKVSLCPESNDPILKMEAYLTGKGLFSTEFRQQVAAAFGPTLDAAIAAAETPQSGLGAAVER